jgi:hypothetical protein
MSVLDCPHILLNLTFLYEEAFRLVSTAFSRAVRLLDYTVLFSYSGTE